MADLKSMQKELNELTSIINQKNEAEKLVPEVVLGNSQLNGSIDIVRLEEFSDLAEKVASLQLLGNTREEILKTLEIDRTQYKEIIDSEEYSNAKGRLVNDKKTWMLSKVLDEFNMAVSTLHDLMVTADEDKVRLQSAALLLEQAREMLENERPSNVGIAQVIKDATNSSDSVTVNMAQLIIDTRKNRGLE